MAVTVQVYNIFKTNIMAGITGSYTLDGTAASTNPVFVGLVNNSYSFDPDTKYVGEILGTYEVSGTAYAAGGHALSSPAISQDDADDEGVFDAADWELGASTITARGAVLYASTGETQVSCPLICFVDFGQDEVSTAGSFKITWAAEGILNLT